MIITALSLHLTFTVVSYDSQIVINLSKCLFSISSLFSSQAGEKHFTD